MIVTFEEKDNKKYEIQNEHVDQIFENVKTMLDSVFEKYGYSDKDTMIATVSLVCIVEKIKNKITNEYGADKIIELTGAKEL
jgi:hypothetical protein